GGSHYKVFRGMASHSAAAARLAIEGRPDALDQYAPEAEEMDLPLRAPVAEVARELVGGLRSGMSYIDAATIPECWQRALFVRQTQAGTSEAPPGAPGACLGPPPLPGRGRRAPPRAARGSAPAPRPGTA